MRTRPPSLGRVRPKSPKFRATCVDGACNTLWCPTTRPRSARKIQRGVACLLASQDCDPFRSAVWPFTHAAPLLQESICCLLAFVETKRGGIHKEWCTSDLESGPPPNTKGVLHIMFRSRRAALLRVTIPLLAASRECCPSHTDALGIGLRACGGHLSALGRELPGIQSA